MNWVSTKEKLPNIDTSEQWNTDHKITKEVLCLTKEYGYRFGRYFHLAGFWTVNGVTSSNGVEVEYWAELSSPLDKPIILTKEDEISLYEKFLDDFCDKEGILKPCNPDAIFNWFAWKLWRRK